PAGCPADPPSEPDVPVGPASGSSKPRRLASGAALSPGCCLLGAVPWQAASVEETMVGGASVVGAGHLVREELAVDRLAGDGEPLFPLLWALRLVIGVEQEVPADRASAVLL